MRKTIAALAMLTALAAAGCGSSDSQTDTAAAERAAARRAAAIRAARDHARRAATYQTCRETLEPLQEALGELDSRLSIGLNYGDYGTRVADVQVVYDRLDWEALSEDIDCLGGVGVPLERAFNQHIRAQNMWSECFDDWDCDNDSISPSLQSHWAKASRGVEKSIRNLEKMDPGPAPNVPASANQSDGANAASNGERILDVLDSHETGALKNSIKELTKAIGRTEAGDTITCQEWLDAPRAALEAFAAGIIGGRADDAPRAAIDNVHLVERVTGSCELGRADAADGFIAREILLATGQEDRLGSEDRDPDAQ